jgi:hypothetical protein
MLTPALRCLQSSAFFLGALCGFKKCHKQTTTFESSDNEGRKAITQSRKAAKDFR